VAGIAARDKARAEAFGLRHGIPTAYGSYDELLADPDVDAVYNPLPNSLHARWTLAAIAAGKHVLCEKPFASNAAQATQVADAAEASGLVVMEAMHYRYHPLVRRLRELVTGGELGPVQHIQAWTTFIIEDPDDIRYDYDLAGGALMDGGCYAIDCLRMLAGADSGAEITVTGALADPWELAADGAGDGASADGASADGASADGADDTGAGAVAEAGAVADRAVAARLALPGGVSGWFDSSFTRSGEFRADVHVSCRDGQVWMQNFILAHYGHLWATTGGTVIVDEQASGETTYVWQLRAFAAAVAAATGSGPGSGSGSGSGSGAGFSEVETSAAHAVRTMGVIDDTYRAAGLRLRG
jgi:predicted dehydrogenase